MNARVTTTVAAHRSPLSGYSQPRRLAAFVAVLAAVGMGMTFSAPAAQADTTVTAHQPYQITLEMSECGVMYVGTTGSCVTSLQTWMNYSIGSHLKVDGHYGAATLAAVEQFQRTSVKNVTPNGMFGRYSRAALHRWYWNASNHGKKSPCDISTGRNCDAGAVESGIHAGIYKTIGCTVVGHFTLEAGGVFCDVVLD